MKKSYFTAALMLTCLLGVGISAKAQDADAVVVSVPFEFVAGGVTLPAGEYRINRANPGVTRELAIRSYDKGGVFLSPAAFDESRNAVPMLSYERAGGKSFLTETQ